MGQSTNAILAYGVDLQDEIPAWLWKAFDVEDTGDGVEPLIDALNAIGLDLQHHCSDTHTMYVLCVEASVTVAHRGSPEVITMTLNNTPEAWNETWKPVSRARRPKWLLFSW
ncbi:MAG: hypothetical protein M3Q55_09365 [Acidobacteriota bacterium]|nr:hypothetical protein [Acidobacteriota bacterium]